MLSELVAVNDEFRVSRGAEFVKIHSLPFAFRVYAIRVHAIDQPVQAVRQRKH